jgi:hypothetical protein
LAGGVGLTAGALAAGSAAYATPVRFDNSSLTFEWSIDTLLDVTLSAPSQGSADAYRSLWQYELDEGSGKRVLYGWGSFYSSEPAVDGVNLGYFASGETIGPGNDWYYAGRAATDPGTGTFSPNFLQGYLGVRFGDNVDWNYGWIDARWNPTAQRFDAYAWGYETELNTDIEAGAEGSAIPEPGTLAMFAIGAAALTVARRRRRKAEAERQGSDAENLSRPGTIRVPGRFVCLAAGWDQFA